MRVKIQVSPGRGRQKVVTFGIAQNYFQSISNQNTQNLNEVQISQNSRSSNFTKFTKFKFHKIHEVQI